MLPNPPFIPDKEEDDYLAEIRSFRAAKAEAYGRNWDNKDRYVLSVSSLALGFSLAFLNDEVVDASSGWLLHTGWALFSVSVIAVILSFELNAWQTRRVIRRIDGWVRRGEQGTEPRSGVLYLLPKWGGGKIRVVDWVNSASVWTLIAGIVATVGFVMVNA